MAAEGGEGSGDMPRGSAELTNARREEIISACEKLYQTMSFKEITLKDIASATSFTRTSIYNYFQTKEEIFLALMQKEYERWVEDLDGLTNTYTVMSPEAFAGALASVGAKVYPSAANFLLCDFGRDMRPVIERLRERMLLVRPCGMFPGLTHGHVRLCVRTEVENARLTEVLGRL